MKYNVNNKKLNVNDFQHPLDKSAIDAVSKIPGFEKILELISKNSLEKSYSLINDSSRMKVTKEMSPKIFGMLSEAAEMYDMDCIPEIFIERDYRMWTKLNGISKPHIIFSSSFLEQIDDDALWCAIVSEYAGIQAKHGTIKFIDEIIKLAKGAIPFGIDATLATAINYWYRNRIYTYDRAYLLASENFEKTARHILFGAVSDEVFDNLKLDQPDNTYLKQALELSGQTGAEGLARNMSVLFSPEQLLTSRYIELYIWYNSGEYYDVLEGCVRNNGI